MTTAESLWPGWSADREDVDLTRVLAGLFAGVPAGANQTKQSIAAIAEEIGVWTGRVHRHADRLIHDFGLFNTSFISPPVESCAMVLTPRGHQVAGEFRRQTSEPRFIRPAARRALLLWRDCWQPPSRRPGITFSTASGARAADWPRIDEFLSTPRSWFYGRQFTASEVADAAEYLRDHGYVELVDQKFTLPVAPVHQDRRVRQLIRLTGSGTTCAEQFDGHTDQFEAARRGSTNTVNNYGRIGNAAAGPVGTQTASEMSHSATLAALTALMLAIDEMGWLAPTPPAILTELAAATTEDALVDATIRARQLILDALSDSVLPANVIALLTAAADVVGHSVVAAGDQR